MHSPSRPQHASTTGRLACACSRSLTRPPVPSSPFYLTGKMFGGDHKAAAASGGLRSYEVQQCRQLMEPVTDERREELAAQGITVAKGTTRRQLGRERSELPA